MKKKCKNCGKNMDLEVFHKDKNSKDGRTSWCKKCTKGYMERYAVKKRLQKVDIYVKVDMAWSAEDMVNEYSEQLDTMIAPTVSKAEQEPVVVETEEDLSEYKTCSKCATMKPATDYHKNKKSKDGLASQCKACKKAARAKTKVIREL